LAIATLFTIQPIKYYYTFKFDIKPVIVKIQLRIDREEQQGQQFALISLVSPHTKNFKGVIQMGQKSYIVTI
jgi:hypothetical protein